MWCISYMLFVEERNKQFTNANLKTREKDNIMINEVITREKTTQIDKDKKH